MAWSLDDIPAQDGRVAMITGANGGLGLASATALAGRGAHVVMAARNQEKAAAARDAIRSTHPDASLEVVPLDLSSLASVRAAGALIGDRHDHIDLVMLNAGVMATPEGRTEDGFETQLGTNVLGHWVLLSILLPAVLRTEGSRVVTLSSVAQHQGRAVDPDNPHLSGRYDPWRAYAQSKLAMRHLALGLHDQLRAAGHGTRSLVAHPGLTDSDLQATTVDLGGGGVLGTFFHSLSRLAGMGVETGVLSQLRAATDPNAPSGAMFGPLGAVAGPPVRKPLVRPGSSRAIERLWRTAERETGQRVDVAEAIAAP